MAEKIQNILDYLDWRGDVPFSAVGLNEVDSLVFAQLSYLNFGGIAPSSFSERMTLGELSESFFSFPDFAERKELGLVINPLTLELLEKCGNSARFGPVGICGFNSTYDEENGEQFCAMTFLLEDRALVAFRGTDDTLTGWKEDFHLAFQDPVPAQRDSVEYLEKALSSLDSGDFCVLGHSKGGNLALYACSQVGEDLSQKIGEIYNFDGPGFSGEKLNSAPFKRIEGRVKSFFPQFSVIGMLFHHFPDFSSVRSAGTLVMQHDPFSWAVLGASFVRTEKLDSGSEQFHRVFNSWVEGVPDEKRRELVETVFSVLESSNASNLNELSANWSKSAVEIVRAIARLDVETKKSAWETFTGIFRAV